MTYHLKKKILRNLGVPYWTALVNYVVQQIFQLLLFMKTSLHSIKLEH